MPQDFCPNCNKELTKLQLMTLNGAFTYKVPVCPHCRLQKDGTEYVIEPIGEGTSFNTITCDSISGKSMKMSHRKDIVSRCIADDGVTVLKGEKGLKHMKEKSKTNPEYNKRLKEYYSL